jgi:protease-4
MDTDPAAEGGFERTERTPAGVSGWQGGVPAPPAPIIVQQNRGLFGRFGKFLWIALLLSLMFNVGQRIAYEDYFLSIDKIQEKYCALSRHAKDKVAVIRVEGAILEGDGFVKRQIDQVSKDTAVKAVVLRIDSAGGTVTASDYLYHHLRRMRDKRRIPVVVSMGSLCASGGYYVAMAVGDQEECILAEPTSWTGSIGVLIPHYDVSGLLERWHVRDDSIASGPLKQLGSPTRALSDEERTKQHEILQAMVDDAFTRFKDIVRAGRPQLRGNAKKLELVTTGQVFTANQALEHGLVDRIGFIEDAMERAIAMAGLDKTQVRVVKYTRQVPGILDMLVGSEARVSSLPEFSVGQLMDLTAPRPYYLCTWLPAVLSNAK